MKSPERGRKAFVRCRPQARRCCRSPGAAGIALRHSIAHPSCWHRSAVFFPGSSPCTRKVWGKHPQCPARGFVEQVGALPLPTHSPEGEAELCRMGSTSVNWKRTWGISASLTVTRDTDIGACIAAKTLLSHSQVRVGCQLCLCIALCGTFVKAPAAAVAGY